MRSDPSCSPCSTPEATEVLLLVEMLEMQSFFLRLELLLVNATEFQSACNPAKQKNLCLQPSCRLQPEGSEPLQALSFYGSFIF